MKRFFGASLTALAVVSMALSLTAFAANASPGHPGRATICHATGSATNPYLEITAGWHAIYGRAGHFSEPGNPNEGHEEDYEGPCAAPTAVPTDEPTAEPTQEPTDEPTQEPTEEPTVEPTDEPTAEPTQEPTDEPTAEPTDEPTQEPTDEPTEEPGVTPTPTRERENPPAAPQTGGGWEEIGLLMAAISLATGTGGITLLRRRSGK
ncbi:MAG: PT domain-containing protein [Patescibacteria group bacterium]